MGILITQWSIGLETTAILSLSIVPPYSELLEAFSHSGLMQFNNVYNTNNRLLDLIFCNKFYINNLVHSNHPLLPENASHPSLEFLFDCPHTEIKEKCKKIYLRNFKQAKYAEMDNDLISQDWLFLLNSNNSLETNVATFNDIYFK